MKNNIIIGIAAITTLVLGVIAYYQTHSPLYRCLHSDQAVAIRANPMASQLAAMVGKSVDQLLEQACQELIATQPGVF